MIRIYVFLVLVLILAKPIFMLYHQANHPFTFGDVMQVMGHGITLDLSTALYLIIVPFLLTLLSIWLWSWNGIFRLLKIYYVIIAFALSLAFVSDTSLYEFWGFKLDASVLPYLSTPKEAFASVSVWYLLVRVTSDYANDIIGMWEGQVTRDLGDATNGELHRWECKADGTYVFYSKVNGEWTAVPAFRADYFVDGTLLCTRWQDTADSEELREWWEIESIKGGVMKGTALRLREDGRTYTATFQMSKVN